MDKYNNELEACAKLKLKPGFGEFYGGNQIHITRKNDKQLEKNKYKPFEGSGNLLIKNSPKTRQYKSSSPIKQMTKNTAMYILMDYLLPHIGELNFKAKALFIGYVVKRLLLVYVGMEKPTNRDKYSYKRIEITGTLLHQLFREYYIKQWKAMHRILDAEYFWKQREGSGIYTGLKFQHIIENKSFDIESTEILM